MLIDKLANYRIVLASGSPRRQELLKQLGLRFEVRVPQVSEVYPAHLKRAEIALFLSRLKADAFLKEDLTPATLLITADTIVWHEDGVLPKPASSEEAFSMLSQLSGQAHDVITAVTLRNRNKEISFFSDTRVYFKVLAEDEIQHYIDVYKPYDKAGAYGIQEWIGFIGIERIEGSYYNVMGLPVQMLYTKLQEFIKLLPE